jgi:Crinkler effector protein N-terminal domain
MSEPDEITLWCWVLGDPYGRVFSVSIKRNVTIEKLREAIQGKKSSFKDIAADTLTVYKVGGWYR